MHIEHYSPRRARSARSGCGGVLTFFLLLAVVAALAAAGIAAFITLRSSPAALDLGPAAGDLNPIERASLALYLASSREALNTPAGGDPTPVAFAVRAGENAASVAARLAEMELVRDGDLLRFYMRYRGLDNQIEAGTFYLSRTMTIRAVAEALASALPDEVTVRIWEGWRVEQIAEYLAAQPNLSVDHDEFLKMIRPGGTRPGSYSFLGDIPAAASLEGFLFPDTYRFLPKADAAAALDRFLARFDSQVTTAMRADAAARGMSLFQAITLASIVEREAVHDEERPLIAGVFLNRLALGMPLDADPTTQYAIAAPGNWWPPLDFDPRTVDHPYNTYVHAGLPPGPIANPGLSSIRAVIYPAQTDYLYFRAKCDGSQYHNFSVSYGEHVNYACP